MDMLDLLARLLGTPVPVQQQAAGDDWLTALNDPPAPEWYASQAQPWRDMPARYPQFRPGVRLDPSQVEVAPPGFRPNWMEMVDGIADWGTHPWNPDGQYYDSLPYGMHPENRWWR